MPQDGVPMVVVYLKDAVIPQILKLIMVNYYYFFYNTYKTVILLSTFNKIMNEKINFYFSCTIGWIWY